MKRGDDLADKVFREDLSLMAASRTFALANVRAGTG